MSFWDRRKTGVFYPWDTYNGCRALGFNPLFALSYALAFHLLHASYWTSESWLLNPLLPVYVARIHRAKHGSDTGTYDIDGRFNGENFHDIFKRYDKCVHTAPWSVGFFFLITPRSLYPYLRAAGTRRAASPTASCWG